ncbi:MAG: serine hydrolase [Saprospiraceae bacterium]|nr:serine hydrolase [Saprospiraceae bacterium]
MNRIPAITSAIVGTGFVVLFSLLGMTYALGQSKAQKIDQLISTYADYGRFNGTILVANADGILYKNGFGWANLEWEIQNTADTKFRLASITKQFTALLIMQLVEEGKLSLEAPISTYLPNFPKEKGDQITIHHLMTHTSGIPNFTSFPNYREVMRRPNSVDDLVRLFADSSLVFTPGERHAYSNSAYVLLGQIIEKSTGKTYEQVLQDQIFTPLKMDNSGYDHHHQVLKKRAAGYYINGRTFVNANYIDMSTPYAAGAIYSTVEDLYLWDRALYTEKLVSQRYRDLLFEKHSQLGRMHYGYGWELGQMPVGNVGEYLAANSHSGGINGFNTFITRIPSTKALIVILSNTGNAPLFEMTVGINGILEGKDYDFPKKSLAYDLLDWIKEEGIEKALGKFKASKESEKYYLNENEMNLAGYELLQDNKTQEAASVFRMNVEAYPRSSNVYDSYGEALLALGRKEEAITHYKKSIQLNPNNENGLQVLKSLGLSTDSLVYKVPLEQLQLLAGDYLAIRPSGSTGQEWKIMIEEADGKLFGNDRGYRYELVPIGKDQFINPADGASIQFDSRDKEAITMTLFEKYNFKKVK